METVQTTEAGRESTPLFPMPGEVYVNPHGLVLLTFTNTVGAVMFQSQHGAWYTPCSDELAHVGPLRRVFPPTDEPAVPVVEDRADEPGEPSYAASLRELADFLDANPDMPMPRFSAGISGGLGHSGEPDAAIARVKLAAELLGVPVQDQTYDDGDRHLRAERTFGRIELRLSYVIEAEVPAVDGSPSDLDGSPEADAVAFVEALQSLGLVEEDGDPS